jgi:hypothetical protein
MQTARPELIRHMDARREQRELAAKWRLARAGRRRADAAPAPAQRRPEPAASGAAAILSS